MKISDKGTLEEWKELTASCRHEFEKRMRKMDGIMPSTLCFEGILAWGGVCKASYAIVEDYFCIEISDIMKGKNYFYMPIGAYSETGLESLMAALFDSRENAGFIFCDVSENQLAYFRALKKYKVKITSDRGYSDYIYSMEDFEKSLAQPDARYNEKYFIRKYQPECRSLSAECVTDCVQVIEDSFCQYHDCRGCANGCLKKTIKSFLEQYDETYAGGVMVKTGEQYIGYAAGAMTNDTFVFLFRKNCREYRGLSEYLHRKMIEIYKGRSVLVNYTEDMNLEGLRKYKQKLAPYRLSPKYKVKVERQR